ncbi:uncharacterized protein PG986_008984 [Apiospora aurea]|uniref:Uncharacterized protein n=1 Tax=Apiospora aurea TaxID=335848 RepID=A0ABR1Q6F9_9PEZI
MDPMDPDEWDEDTAAMAEAMGFASFGGQAHGSKRRKYNARADDAYVAGAGGDESTLLFHDAGSGSNNTPLGERRQPTKKQKTKANEDEIDLDDDDDDNQNKAADTNDAQDPAPQYIDTSLPPDLAQSELDALVASGGGAAASQRGGVYSQRGAGNRRSGRDRASGPPWWEDYYDPAFNTNPWEKIEKARGLQPRGPWLSYDESKTTWASIKDQSTSSSAAAAATEAAVAQAA